MLRAVKPERLNILSKVAGELYLMIGSENETPLES